jgi:hypothetical protein
MHHHNRTNLEFAYWIEKYILFCGSRLLTSLIYEGGFCYKDLCLVAASWDLIGWTELLHGKDSVEFATIQHIHCAHSPSCRLTKDDWMKVFVSQLIQISQSQWIFCNYTLHNKKRGYFVLRECSEVLQKVNRLLDTTPAGIPKESQYPLEQDHSTMYNTSYERQAYWVLAMQPAPVQDSKRRHGSGHKDTETAATKAAVQRPHYNNRHSSHICGTSLAKQ